MFKWSTRPTRFLRFDSLVSCPFFFTSCDYPFRAQMIRDYLAKGNKPPVRKAAGSPDKVKDCLHRAVHFYSMLQTDDGHWSGDYGGPMFLLPGLVVAWYMMGKSDKMISASEIAAMTHYITVHQQMDGGWGTHSTYS
jgi:hypothetical protein